MTEITLQMALYLAAGAAVLASTDAGKVSRIGIEVVRGKLGVSALAVYAPKQFIEQQVRQAQTDQTTDEQATAGEAAVEEATHG